MSLQPADDPWRVYVAGPAEPASPSTEPRSLAAALRLPAAVAVGLVLLGAPVGILWAHTSPRIAVSFSAQGPALEHPESSEFFATDASFLIAMLLAGVVSGAVVWALTRGRGPGVPVGIAAGTVVAAVLARVVGGRVVVDERLARVCRNAACDIYDGTLQVRSAGLVVVWAVVALAVFAALTAVFDGEEPPPPAGPWPPAEAWSAPGGRQDWPPPTG